MGTLWVFITVVAALLQAIRTSLQKHVAEVIPPVSLTFARFSFGLPLALVYLLSLTVWSDKPIPMLNLPFIYYAIGAAVFQGMSTLLLIYLFARRNFAISTTYARTEAIQAAIFGAVFFGEYISWAGFVAILMGVMGILLISVGNTHLTIPTLVKGFTRNSARLGVTCGAFFALSALCIRSASLSLETGDVMTRAALTLLVVILIETIIFGAYMLYKEGTSGIKVMKEKSGILSWIGITSVLGSIGWFTAMTLEKAAYVKTVGQVEIIFSLIISHLIFRERSNRYEIIGMCMVLVSIVGLVLH